MKRGDIVLVLQPGSPAAKARPCVVVQRSSVAEHGSKATVCPLTTTLHGPDGQRPLVSPSPENGLRSPSEVEVDWIFTFPKERIGATIGRMDGVTMEWIDQALRRWLEL